MVRQQVVIDRGEDTRGRKVFEVSFTSRREQQVVVEPVAGLNPTRAGSITTGFNEEIARFGGKQKHRRRSRR